MEKNDSENTKSKKLSKEERQARNNAGHRERARKKYIENGIDIFTDYEILEFLLFNPKKGSDTKIIAKELLEKFKTLEGVFKAELKDLKSVNDVGEVMATYIKFIGDLPKRVYRDFLLDKEEIVKIADSEEENDNIRITNKDILLNYLKHEIGYQEIENFYVLYLSSSNQVIKIEKSSSGTLDRSSVYPREIYKRVIELKAKSIIIAHNHPSGNITPSKSDIELTNEIAKGLKNFGAILIEHIIITKNSYFSFLEEGLI